MLTKGDWVYSGWTGKQILSKVTGFKGLSIWVVINTKRIDMLVYHS